MQSACKRYEAGLAPEDIVATDSNPVFVEQEEKKLALEMEILSKKYAFLMGQDLVMMKQESSKRIKNLLRYHIQVGATKKTEV